MSYNRSTAKAKATSRAQEGKGLSFRMHPSYAPPVLPVPSRCRHCGSPVNVSGGRCPSCWRPL